MMPWPLHIHPPKKNFTKYTVHVLGVTGHYFSFLRSSKEFLKILRYLYTLEQKAWFSFCRPNFPLFLTVIILSHRNMCFMTWMANFMHLFFNGLTRCPAQAIPWVEMVAKVIDAQGNRVSDINRLSVQDVCSWVLRLCPLTWPINQSFIICVVSKREWTEWPKGGKWLMGWEFTAGVSC